MFQGQWMYGTYIQPSKFWPMHYRCCHVIVIWAIGNKLAWWLQPPIIMWSAFVTFPAGFPQARSMGKPVGKATSHYYKVLPASLHCALLLPGHCLLTRCYTLLPLASLHLCLACARLPRASPNLLHPPWYPPRYPPPRGCPVSLSETPAASHLMTHASWSYDSKQDGQDCYC